MHRMVLLKIEIKKFYITNEMLNKYERTISYDDNRYVIITKNYH